MDLFFIILLVVMLLLFGYAQLHKDIVKTPGRMITTNNEEEEVEINHQ